MFKVKINFKNKKLIGDFIGIEGEVFKTQKGEISVSVKNIKIPQKQIISFFK